MVASTRFTKKFQTATSIIAYTNRNAPASPVLPEALGSFHYGQINITRTIKIVNNNVKVGGKLRYTINGVSHVDGATPLELAEYFGFPEKSSFIFENHETTIQSWHLDGYSFFVVAMEPGKWTPVKRKNYNLLDGVSKHTIQVFPHSWSAVMLTFDNVGMWNLRSELRRGGLLREQNRDEAIIVTDAIAADKKVNFDMNPACA
ncbi:hypothetical protein MLD38_005103 [Melastoma candidum]|uniref:Uncharacterized protein n=1 Tax=Melastoma candidum TaxID=119954 RepID=A0ACB9SCQ8_9MYRT|nr:hypothetical protein MLD38_005103 [Melastoma candidum]